MREKRSRGNPPTDVAWRLRNWCWFWMVKRRTQLSDDGLDRLCFGGGADKRRRFFERVRTIGSDPSLPNTDLNGRSAFDMVHEKKKTLEPAKRLFQSRLWEILSRPDFPISECRHVAATILHERGWYRFRKEDYVIAVALSLEDKTFAISENLNTTYRSMLSETERTPSANAVTLLVALYKEAVAERAFVRAITLEKSLRNCVSAWSHAFEWPPKIAALLRILINDRVIKNLWRKPDLRVGEGKLSQRIYVDALVSAHLDFDLDPNAYISDAILPVVERARLPKNFERLQQKQYAVQRALDDHRKRKHHKI